MPTIAELGQKAKVAYPGKFDDLADAELGRQLKLNNPGIYDEYADVPTVSAKRKQSVPHSAVSKTFDIAMKAFDIAAKPTAQKILAPAAEMLLNPDDETRARLEAVKHKQGIVYGSDVAEAIAPGIFESDPNASLVAKLPKIALRVLTDIATDPTSYVGVGIPTKLGRLLKIVHETNQAGDAIKLSSPLAMNLAKELGLPRPTPTMVKDALENIPAKTVSEQIAKGQKGLVSLVNPFTSESVGNIGKIPTEFTGSIAGKIVKPLSLARRGAVGAKIEDTLRGIFSTKSGNPDFDVLIGKAKDIAMHRKGDVIEDARTMYQSAKDVQREFGITPEELNSAIRTSLESVQPITKAQAKAKYSKEVTEALDTAYRDKLVDAQVNLVNAHASGDAAKIDQYAKEVADYQGHLNTLHGQYKPPPSINPQVDKLINNIREANAQQLLRDQTSGVKVVPQMADIGYMAHVATPEALKARFDYLRKTEPNKLPNKMSGKELSDDLANALHREFTEVKPQVIDAWREAGIITGREAKTIKGKNGLAKMYEMLQQDRLSPAQYTDAVHTMTIDEVNALARQGKIRSLGDYRGDLFHTDPIFATAVRGIHGEQARTAAEFFTEMRRRGLALEDAKAAVTHPNWVSVKQDELKGFKVAPEIAKVLDKWNDFNTNPESLKPVLRAYDRFHSLLKIWTLAPFPAYHTLNAVGNFWNNFLAGVTNPDVYRQALMTQISKADSRYRPVNFKDILGNAWNTDKLTQVGKELGVVGKGQYGLEAQRTLKQALEPGKFLTISSRSHFLRVGNRIGKFIEDNARMAHFIDRLRKGDTAEQAALSVKKFLFDYGDLSSFERQYLNRGFFFYQWTRKNIPLQLHSLVTTPAKFGIPFKSKYEIEKSVPDAPEKYLPEWMKENFPNRIRYDSNTKTYEYFMLNKWLPAADILKLVHLHEVAAQSLSPILKEPLQQLFNQDFYTHKKIQNFKGETAKLFGKDLPVREVHGLKTIRLLNELDKITNSDSDLLSKIMTIGAGKNYPFNPTQARVANYRRVKGEIDDLTSHMYGAAARKDKATVAKLRTLIQEKAQEY